MKPLELHPLALAEAEVAAAWYAERDPRVSTRFVEELEATLERIVESPNLWPKSVDDTRRVPLTLFPYLVHFRDEPTRILVVAIAHAKQNPGYWRGR